MKLVISIIILQFCIVAFAQNAITSDKLTLNNGVYSYNNTVFTGKAYILGKSGVFIAEESYKNGSLHGKRICFDSRGKIISKEKFKKGKGKVKVFYPNGKIRYEGLVINNNERFGSWLFYHSNGRKKAEELWGDNGELIEEIFYNNNENIDSKLIYKNSILIKEIYFDENGIEK